MNNNTVRLKNSSLKWQSLALDKKSIAIAAPVGLAIFAMFFGAGNLIFPLFLGATTPGSIWITAVGFLLTGVGVPLLGLFAVILYKGDYQSFFASLGKIPAQIMIALLVVLLGICTANPRCGLIAYQTLLPYLPHFPHQMMMFNLVFFSLVFVVSVKRNRLLDIIGYVFSPVKLFLLIILIVVAIAMAAESHSVAQTSNLKELTVAMSTGFGTMDLLAAFFFCALIYKHIEIKVRREVALEEKSKFKITFYACGVGAVLLSIVYTGFIIAAHDHASALTGLSADKLISALAILVFGKMGAIFISLTVSFACFVTAVSLTAIAVEYLQTKWLETRASYAIVLLLVLAIVFILSNMGFAKIMNFSMPILNIIYPALVVFTVFRILNHIFSWKISSLPFYVVLLISTVWNLA